MSMHLVKGLTTLQTGRRRKNKKVNLPDQQQLIRDCNAYNKQLRRSHRHDEQLTLEQYIDRLRGNNVKIKKEKPFVPYQTKHEPYRRETPHVPSLGHGVGNGYAKIPIKYTGTLIKGIAQTHKSNAVPVINQEEIIDIRHMRR